MCVFNKCKTFKVFHKSIPIAQYMLFQLIFNIQWNVIDKQNLSDINLNASINPLIHSTVQQNEILQYSFQSIRIHQIVELELNIVFDLCVKSYFCVAFNGLSVKQLRYTQFKVIWRYHFSHIKHAHMHTHTYTKEKSKTKKILNKHTRIHTQIYTEWSMGLPKIVIWCVKKNPLNPSIQCNIIPSHLPHQSKLNCSHFPIDHLY